MKKMMLLAGSILLVAASAFAGETMSTFAESAKDRADLRGCYTYLDCGVGDDGYYRECVGGHDLQCVRYCNSGRGRPAYCCEYSEPREGVCE